MGRYRCVPSHLRSAQDGVVPHRDSVMVSEGHRPDPEEHTRESWHATWDPHDPLVHYSSRGIERLREETQRLGGAAVDTLDVALDQTGAVTARLRGPVEYIYSPIRS